ncbi:MAG TPA: hypothetical protein VJV23_01110 [Candidatus Polarisedimenticolia bacterium]|nr:hypothetical protein [Candidatus Polarisedimenticolia bacterium]
MKVLGRRTTLAVQSGGIKADLAGIVPADGIRRPGKGGTMRRGSTILSAGAAVLLAAGALAFGAEIQCPSCAITIPCAGTHWIALPTSTGILKAEDLCATLGPAVTSVAQIFPDGTGQFTWQCSGSCSGAPEAGSCGSSCFCIDDGEGYEIVTTGPVSTQIFGRDDAVTIALPAGGDTYLVSPPCVSSAFSARRFLDAIPGGNLSTTDLTGRDGCTGGTSTMAGSQLTQGFSLQPGRAYRLRVGHTSGLTYANPVNPSPAGPPPMLMPQTQTYCISGTSDGVGWSWWIDLKNDAAGMLTVAEPHDPAAGPIAMGLGPAEFSDEFIGGIGFVCPGIAQPVTDPGCFSVTAPASFAFWVGAFNGTPNCNVTSGSGCSFNPHIALSATGMPALHPAAMAALIALLLSAGWLVIRSRHRREGIRQARR